MAACKIIENKLIEYYSELKEKNKLEYEIKLLENNSNRLFSNLKNLELLSGNAQSAKDKLKNNIEIIVQKQLKINKFIEEYAEIEYKINQLEEEDQKLLRLRYDKRYSFQKLNDELHMSKSSLIRRKSKLLNIISNNFKNSIKL
ncbi:hypothetical protein IAI10_16190 [Clostridium sp. 19966]|uniref:hypothetical protein n=1 Tax=Clostridium sp. 19966 TaxID=2768166 RepID=UPI0028DF7A19|nr:hypothetical protein [Clostridium sp. 19966]MDT8718207.1 hypothetical protein [Clostridium sp. 19966]